MRNAGKQKLSDEFVKSLIELNNLEAFDDRVGMVKEIRENFSADLVESESTEEESENRDEEWWEAEEIAELNEVEAAELLNLFYYGGVDDVEQGGCSSENVVELVDYIVKESDALAKKLQIGLEKISENNYGVGSSRGGSSMGKKNVSGNSEVKEFK